MQPKAYEIVQVRVLMAKTWGSPIKDPLINIVNIVFSWVPLRMVDIKHIVIVMVTST